MRRYYEYKDSGIEWIGAIPKEWLISWFKYYFNTKTGISITRAELLDSGVDCIGYGPIHSQYGFDLDLKRDCLKKAPIKYLSKKSSLVAENDFIFCDTSEDISGSGNNVYVKNLGGKYLLAGSHTILAHPISNFNSRYFAYLFTTKQWRAQIQSNVFGVKVFSITQKMLRNTLLCVPTLLEQQKIVTYLDCKTAAIDKLIADKQKLVTLLQEKRTAAISEAVTKGLDKTVNMKDSGVDWIGEIPEGWTVKKLGYVSSAHNGDRGVNYPSGDDMVAEGIPFISTSELVNGTLILDNVSYITQEKYKQLGGLKIEVGDILYCLRGSVGKNGVAHFSGGTIASSLMGIRIQKAYPSYVSYLLNSPIEEQQRRYLTTGSVSANLSAENVMRFIFAFPPDEEQLAIANFLDQKTAQIDALTSDINEQIEKLKEYRQAVISEAVTGKVAV